MSHQLHVMRHLLGAEVPGPVQTGSGGHPGCRQPSGARIAVAGAHGGAGVSTLALLLGSARDLGVVPGKPGPLGMPLVLAARCSASSAGRAVDAMRVLVGRGIPVAVLAVTGDGLPEPAEASYRFRVLDGYVGGVVRIPFIPALRATPDPREVRLPRAARRALDDIHSLTASRGGFASQPEPGT
jgi:hypothetical protein